MKKPGLFIPFLFAALLGSCNPDVFIDSCAPATDQLQVPADGTAAVCSKAAPTSTTRKAIR